MNRKNALILTLVLCIAAGVFSCITVYSPNAQPAMSSEELLPKQAMLTPPKGEVQNKAEEKKAVLPALPVLPDAEIPAADSASESNPRYRYTASHSSQRLFIRDGGSMRANIIGSLQPGESGEVITLGETWVYLKYKDIEGYVFREYLDLEEIPQSEGLPES